MLLLAAFAFSQCKGMNTIDKKQSERSTKYNKFNSSPVVASAKSTPSKDLVSPSSHLHKSNSTSKHHTLPRHHSNSKKRRHNTAEDDDVWTEHISSSGRIYYYNRKTDESQWEKPKGYVKKLKSDSHPKGELKPHSKPSSDSHFKPSDSHFKSVDSHSKSTDFHSKSLDYHSDRKHGHQSSTSNKHHHYRDHRHGNSEHRASSAGTHRLLPSHDKKPSEHNSSSSNRESYQMSKLSRTPQKVSTGSESCPSPIHQDTSAPCSSPMLQQQHPPQQLCPLALKPMVPCQQQQHEHQNFPPNQVPQFLSPQQQHQLSFMPQSNGPPLEGGILGPYRPWGPTQLPPLHTREQGGFPPAVSPLLPTVFSPGGGPPGRGEHLPPPHPAMSMDNLSQGLHPLQQALLLQNKQQHNQTQLITPVNTPGGTPINTPCKPLLPELSLPPLSLKNTPHTPNLHPLSNPSTPHLHKHLGGTTPYQLFSEQHSRPSFDRTHSLPTSCKDLMDQFQTDSKMNTSDPHTASSDIINNNKDSQSIEVQEAEQQKIQIGMDYFNKPLTEFWITPAYDSLEKQLCQSSVDSLTHKHLEGRRLSGIVKRFSMHSNAKQLRSFVMEKKVEGVRKMAEEFLNKR